eukprot:903323-Amphidinium_carterae.2
MHHREGKANPNDTWEDSTRCPNAESSIATGMNRCVMCSGCIGQHDSSSRCPSEEAGRYFSAVSVSDDTMKTVLGGRLPGQPAQGR